MKFSKYQGTGNDFILAMGGKEHLHPDQIAHLCDRRYGIGGDGLILAKDGEETDVSMEIFNANGERAKMCGNGLRCLVQYLIDRGLKKNHITIDVGKRQYSGWADGSDIVIDMGVPHILERGEVLDGIAYDCIDTGVPHFIHFCKEIDRSDFVRVARGIRHHSHFAPLGVNVNFVRRSPSGLFHMRTYERGVEDETLSCGTGAAAVCVAAWQKYGMEGERYASLREIHMEVEFFSGERLQFDLLISDGLLMGLFMRGRAVCVFEGEVEI